MSKKSKKIIFMVVLILAITLIGSVLWYLQNGNSGGTKNGTSIRDFLPFGQAPTEPPSVIPPPTTPVNPQNQTSGSELPRLRKISEKPIAGALAFKSGESTLVRFVDKASGHIFEANVQDTNLQRLTNTTMPKIQEAVWAGENSVVLRYLKEDEETIESVVLKLVPRNEALKPFEFKKNLKEGDMGTDVLNLQRTLNRDTETVIAESGPGSKGNETNRFGPKTTEAVKKFQVKYSDQILKPQNLETPSGLVDGLSREKLNEITGVNIEQSKEEENLYQTALTFLPENIKDLAFIGSLQKIFYLEEDSLGTIGTLADTSNQKKVQIFESGATEWNIHKNRNDMVISTKASSNSIGLSYSLSSAGSMKKILGGQFGLTLNVSPTKEKAIYSESTRDGFVLNLYNVTQNKILKLDYLTLPEKCVWSRVSPKIVYCAVPKGIPAGNYPETWYQGEVSFEDNIWMMNSETGEETLVETFNLVDGTDLFLSDKEQYLFFTNKKDSQLWSLRLFENETTVVESGAEN